MKYFKFNGEIYAFNGDGTQDSFIKPEMIPMTAEEIDRHQNPNKFKTAEEKYQIYLKNLAVLTRRQFKLTLLHYGLLDSIEQKLAEIPDANLRTRMQIEYSEATEFHRTSDSVSTMIQILGLTSNQVNAMWEWGLTQ